MDKEKCEHEYRSTEARYNTDAREIYRRYVCNKCGHKFYTIEFEVSGNGDGNAHKCEKCNRRYSFQKLGGVLPADEVIRQKRCFKCGKIIQTVEFKVINNKLFKTAWSKTYYRAK